MQNCLNMAFEGVVIAVEVFAHKLTLLLKQFHFCCSEQSDACPQYCITLGAGPQWWS